VNVFLHTCEEDGTFVSYFVPSDEEEHCGDAGEEVVSCCASEQLQTDDDCCEDETQLYKIKLDFFQKITAPFIPMHHPVQVADCYSVDLIGEDTPIHNYANPPPKKRSVARSLSQVWII